MVEIGLSFLPFPASDSPLFPMPYSIRPIKELRDQQVRYAPREKKIEQMERAEKFYNEIDTEKDYSYKSICFLITEYRPEMYAELVFPGKDVKSDLLQFIDDLAESIAIPLEQVKEPVWTIEQLCKKFSIRSKTLLRWRRIGLISRRFLLDGKKRVGFLNSSVERFVANNPDCVRRGENFSQLTEEERQEIIKQAKKMSANGKTPTEVAQQLSQKIGRSIETIRYTLKAFDEANAECAVFPNRHTPLSKEIRQTIYQAFRKKESIESLAGRHKRTQTHIDNIIRSHCVRRIMGLPLDYIDSPEFHAMTDPALAHEAAFTANFEDEIVGSEVFVETANHDSTGLPPYLAGLYAIPLLSAEQETFLFRKMNYLKFKASQLRETLGKKKARKRKDEMTQIEDLYDQSVQIKNEIIASNLRLVVSIAKRHVSPTSSFFELVSDGNLILMKAVEKFDYTRGNKFSTYATWAMMRHFARSIPKEKKYHDRFHSSEEEILESAEDLHISPTLEEKIQAEREDIVRHFMSELSEREQQILAGHYGFFENVSPKTLRQISSEMHVSKERVRQIEIRALAKLRKLAKEEHLDIP